MKIGLQSWGSAGDVRPLLALAQGLHLAGHEVDVVVSRVDANEATQPDYAALAPSAGFPIRQAGRLSYSNAALRDLVSEIQGTRSPVQQLERMMRGLFDPMCGEIFEASKRLARDNDVVIGHQLMFPLWLAAKKADRPYFTITFLPSMIPSAHQPPSGLPDLGRFLNPALWRIADFAMRSVFTARLNRLCLAEGVPFAPDFFWNVASSQTLNLIAVSGELVRALPDWPAQHRPCGFLDMPTEPNAHPLPPELEAFLGSGPPPVFMALGSMLLGDSKFESLTATLVKAAELAGCRAIVQSAWEEITTIPQTPNLFRAGKIPHAAVFPRCAAIVHHGGAGTSHSATRAGRPSIVVPFAYDQGYWARRLQEAGVALAPLPRRSLRADTLAKRIRDTMENGSLKARAARVGEAMRIENGVAQAVRLVEAALVAGAAALS
ncbi:MAG: glycosyltransferase family 1 protein [Spirochaetes bacterium]|nr:glycosyltransferase family 1 protein [Spirochaetota bacterium]